MPRLIDENKACRIVEQLFCGVCRSYTHCDGCPYNNVLMLLRNLPTIDAVPVVRCKDCKWQITAYCPMPSWERKDNHYCYKGAKMDGDMKLEE